MDEAMKERILHLYIVEKLSTRQIALRLHIGRKAAAGVINSNISPKTKIQKVSNLDQYKPLIGQWYKEYPLLKSKQIYERLKEYGYKGGYRTVSKYTLQYRQKKSEYYHALTFVPGEEAQVDWFTVTNLPFGIVYAFLAVLSYSRYAWGKFYPRNSYEFFLGGHIECFRKFNGISHSCRYDNLKSVVLSRYPEIRYNPRFLEFARHYGFGIHLCNTYSAHEKGRVERKGQDIRSFLYGNTSKDINNLNDKFYVYLDKRNDTIHRSTNRKPNEILKEEKLIQLPVKEYSPTRIIPAVLVSKTGFIQFEMNKYSVPNTCASKKADVIAYPEKIEVFINNSRAALHKRIFSKNQTIENPLHREKILEITPKYKYARILQLMQSMDNDIALFLVKAEAEGEDKIIYAHELFKLLKLVSRNTLIWAVKKAYSASAYKLKAVISLLDLPIEKENNPVYPQDTNLLNIKYEERGLDSYDRHE